MQAPTLWPRTSQTSFKSQNLTYSVTLINKYQKCHRLMPNKYFLVIVGAVIRLWCQITCNRFNPSYLKSNWSQNCLNNHKRCRANKKARLVMTKRIWICKTQVRSQLKCTSQINQRSNLRVEYQHYLKKSTSHWILLLLMTSVLT